MFDLTAGRMRLAAWRPAVVFLALAAFAAAAFGADGERVVTFRYHDPAAQQVFLAGDFNGWTPTRDEMTRSADGDFTRDVSLPPRARVEYKFIVDGRWVLDPANPRTCTGGFGPNSEYASPDYVPAPEIAFVETIPHGVVESFQFTSAILHNTRRVQVYLPAGYDAHGRFPSLLFQDGGEYLSLANLANILDYGIAMGRVRPLIAICPDPVNRNAEYMLNDDYRQFVLRELLPHIDSLYATARDDASLRGVAGASLGGLMAVMMAWRSPELFGVAISQSGAFQAAGGRLMSEVTKPAAKPLRLWLDAGTLEGDDFGRPTLALEDSIVTGARRLKLHAPGFKPHGHADAQISGDPVVYASLNEGTPSHCTISRITYPEGHSWGNWRAHLLAALSAMWPMTR